jgi:transposase InsO family protein
MDERMRFVVDHMSGAWSMVALCDHYGISRQTGYKWIARYEAEGAAGLAERSRAPKVHGVATPPALAEAIVKMRLARPSWGPRKIIAKLVEDHPQLGWPVPSTAGEILKRAGLVKRRRLVRRAPPRLGALTMPERPNHVWGVDYKGWVRLGDGRRCEPLTVTDGFSRYLVGLAATGSVREEEARPVMERAFAEHGLPEVIRSDNGPPFASTGVSGLTALSVWWAKLGIRHERIDPGEPQQNGRHERFHRTLLEAMRPPAADRQAQEARFAAFRRDYNEERPHEALKDVPPSRLYARSPRALPDRLPEPDYPAEAAVRKVRSNGEIKWGGQLVHINWALAGEAVALEETETGDWLVHFYNQPLGRIGRGESRLRRLNPSRDDRRSPHGRLPVGGGQ